MCASREKKSVHSLYRFVIATWSRIIPGLLLVVHSIPTNTIDIEFDVFLLSSSSSSSAASPSQKKTAVLMARHPMRKLRGWRAIFRAPDLETTAATPFFVSQQTAPTGLLAFYLSAASSRLCCADSDLLTGLAHTRTSLTRLHRDTLRKTTPFFLWEGDYHALAGLPSVSIDISTQKFSPFLPSTLFFSSFLEARRRRNNRDHKKLLFLPIFFFASLT